MATNFADGTKVAFEQACIANATGMKVAKPSHGMSFGDGVQAGADIQEQSTLSAWWVSNIRQFDEIKFLVDEKDKLISIENASDLNEVPTSN